MKNSFFWGLLLMGLTHCSSSQEVPPSDKTGDQNQDPAEGAVSAHIPSVLCQAWFPKEATSTPPNALVACAQDADCTFGEVRGCCQRFVVAINSAQRGCLAEATPDAGCRAHCMSVPADYKRVADREGFGTSCVEGVCTLSLDGETQAIEVEAVP